MLALAVLAGAAGTALIVWPFKGMGTPGWLLGMCLIALGILNLCVALCAVKKQSVTLPDVLCGLCLGVPNYMSARFLLWALREVPAVVVYPSFSVGTIIVVTLVGVLCFREKVEKRKLIAIDTLCASAGEGLFVKLVLDQKNAGATIEEAAAYANALIPKLAHWFTVEDLVYLKRGGRVSPAVALVGGMLNIKPVMHVDDEGHLIKVGTIRGRKASLNALAEKLIETAEDPANGTIFISHGDCEEDAKYLADLIKSKGGNDVQVITNVGTVIGAHSGPGTMALFFVAKQR